MKTDQQVLDDRDHAEMMRRPHIWPNFVLPLKRYRDGEMDTAVLSNPPEPGQQWVLVEGTTIFGGPPGEQVFYDSPQAILAAGWIVD